MGDLGSRVDGAIPHRALRVARDLQCWHINSVVDITISLWLKGGSHQIDAEDTHIVTSSCVVDKWWGSLE